MSIPMDKKITRVRIAADQPFDGTHYMCVYFEEDVLDPNDHDFEEFEIFKYDNESMNHCEFIADGQLVPARQLLDLTLSQVRAQYPNLEFCY
jgi:hypothetical protein